MLLSDRLAADAAARPLVTLKDLIWLFCYYPLLWVGRAFPDWLFRLLETGSASIHQVLCARHRRAVARIMSQWLDVPREQAEVLGRSFIRNGVRRAYFDLRVVCGKPPVDDHNVRILGREHLDRALAAGCGVVLVSIHNTANGQAKRTLRSKGYPILSVRSGRLPPGFGRLWCRWAEPAYRRTLDLTAPDRFSSDDPECIMYVTRRLRKNGIVHITPDVRYSRTSVQVPFLKGERRLSFGALDLARLNRCALLPFYAFHEDAELRIEFRPPLEPRTDVGPREYTRANRQVLVAEMERQVLAYPSQWECWDQLRPLKP